MTQSELKQLLALYLAGTLPEQDFQRMWTALQEPANKEILMEVIGETWEQPADGAFSADIKQKVWERLAPVVEDVQPGLKKQDTGISVWWAAAAVLLLAGAVTWIFSGKRLHPLPVAVNRSSAAVENKLPRESNKAVLTLADGSVVALDNDTSRVIQQGSTAIRQNNGQLQYNNAGAAAGVSYNILTTPRGGQFRILLPDGTLVWLNAASSIRYPTAFTGNERHVEITGEAYLEVAPNAVMPFSITAGKRARIEVLGTHLNVSAYPEEGNINTTLLEGRVRVKNSSSSGAVLQPGQQASMNAEGVVRVLNDIDTTQTIAWKSGWFQFRQSSLQDVMRQVARWYDVEVSYEGNIPEKVFEGRIQRDFTLEQVLRILERNDLHFNVSGRKITVLPDTDNTY